MLFALFDTTYLAKLGTPLRLSAYDLHEYRRQLKVAAPELVFFSGPGGFLRYLEAAELEEVDITVRDGKQMKVVCKKIIRYHGLTRFTVRAPRELDLRRLHRVSPCLITRMVA